MKTRNLYVCRIQHVLNTHIICYYIFELFLFDKRQNNIILQSKNRSLFFHIQYIELDPKSGVCFFYLKIKKP